MRTIYLVRHAKAEPIADTDKQRALSAIGIIDAQKLGILFSKELEAPDCIFCSDADRTRQTLDLMTQHALSASEVIYDEQLYHASADYLHGLIKSSDGKSIMIIGHNPSLAILLNKIVPTENIAPDMMHFPTGTLAVLGVDNEQIELQKFVKGADL